MARRKAPLETPTDLVASAVQDLSGALTILLADMPAAFTRSKSTRRSSVAFSGDTS